MEAHVIAGATASAWSAVPPAVTTRRLFSTRRKRLSCAAAPPVPPAGLRELHRRDAVARRRAGAIASGPNAGARERKPASDIQIRGFTIGAARSDAAATAGDRQHKRS